MSRHNKRKQRNSGHFPTSQQNQVNQQPLQQGINHRVLAQTYSGPIPPASELSNYEAITPGFAERIMTMAEKNQSHDHDIQSRSLTAARWEVHIGQVCAVIITALAFGTAIVMTKYGAYIPASIVGGSTVCTLGIAFITGRHKTKTK